ncbi:MAG: insulinase family protein [Epulopiscium sp.]|jgi:predicted Zn-dependent peptidase|nr:insulinase family protein [Candidatus Epulonipiscium sp.]
MVIIKHLQNGVRVALEEISDVRSISFGIWVKNGSRNELPEENGISHYIEHMLFKGTEHRSGRDIAEEMDAVGGQINAFTTKEYTCYHTRVLDKHFDSALDVMQDMFLHSRFSPEDVAKERNVISEEISMYDDAPEELVHDMLQENMWKGSSLGMPILGTVDTISNIDSQKLKAYFKKNYHVENTVLSVAGNFRTAEMMEKLEKAFGVWYSEEPYLCHNTKTKSSPVLVTKEKEVGQVHLCIAFDGLERDHALKYPMAVFNTIFGGGMSSLLFQKIREEHGLTYTIYSYTSAYMDTGLFAIYASMNPNQTEQVLDLVFKEIETVKKEKLSKKKIDVTKEQILSNFIIGTESTVNRMNAAGASVLLRNSVQTTEEIIEKIEGITPEDIEKVMDTIFHKEKMSISAVGNIKNINFNHIMEKCSF